ncbi:MAG: MBL fold metallo-hydrolase [Candidatus Omnitrophica bacterium]|nr:MBL fold metallo-hydrolase [Candidatus Omnitrophota bacterium]MDD5736794.1 MBL fold metallo-hydrolase [Candidatus Omnitrophota bacterium]
MQLIIHRGTREIGGSCVELKTDKTRILIDFGLPLDAEIQQKPAYPKIQPDAILISHSHMDHYGLLSYSHPDIPVYMSQGAKELIEVSNIFTPNKTGKVNVHVVKPKKPFVVGDLTITPYQVDHSAFDALAFLIEGEGKRVFYSGDFRGHGRKSALFKMMVDNPPENIDCMIMEGSMLGRGKQKYNDEEEIEGRIVQILKERKNITFLFASSQNIDRLVSAYRACLKTDSVFVIDLYTAFILDKLNKMKPSIPSFDWKNIRILYQRHHADALVGAGLKSLLYLYKKRKIEKEEIKLMRDRILMIERDNHYSSKRLKDIGGTKGLRGARIIYSMWHGYLTDKFKAYCESEGLIIEHVHTSGHATIEDLQAFAGALKPLSLIPIHTFEAKRYPELFKSVKILSDGEKYKI